ncbi:MAG: DUF1365 domain-containing protein [Parvularculaceae bacterium]|nr:DUF1365 domain-containing protein [Parvularculaceae bacterium]
MRAAASIYHGVVTHRRLRPVRHRLAYRVFSMLIDLDRIDEAAGRLRLFSRNQFNLFSFHDRDHADETGAPVARRIRALLKSAGFAGDGPVLLLCYPRILGYAFNPLSVYYCHDASGRVEAALYEVRNTFGGRHSYLIAAGEDGPMIRQSADKAFHVSPFMDMRQRYDFRLTLPGEEIAVVIRQSDAEGPIMNAAFTGAREDMTDKTLVRAFFRYPLMTLKVIVAIHIEAAKLFAKGMRPRRGAPEPECPVTVIRRDAIDQREAA